MKIKLLSVGVFLLSCVCLKAQDNGTHTIKKSESKKPYTSEKKVNGVTVQCYTQDQFDKLPENRKNYYLQHKELFEIIKPKIK